MNDCIIRKSYKIDTVTWDDLKGVVNSRMVADSTRISRRVKNGKDYGRLDKYQLR